MKYGGFTPIREVEIRGREYAIPILEPESYNAKVIRSGDVIEVYQYSRNRYHKFQGRSKNNTIRDPETWKGKDEKNLHRARQNIRRYIWANMNKYSKFVTFTYAENMQNLETFYRDWQIFTNAMKRKGYKLQYLYVLEYQQRGAIHAHCIIFNQEYIPIEVIQNAWGKGHVDINRVKDIKNMGAYVCKYLTKESLAQYNSKSYHVSRGLNKPIEQRKTLRGDEGFMQGIKPIYEVEYDLKHDDIITGQVKYSQYKVEEQKT